MGTKIQIGVIGGREGDPEIFKTAEAVGREIALRNGVLVCGGMSGVMEAACRGAQLSGGLTVGILPVGDAAAANPHVDVVIPTEMGLARNILIINSVSGVIAVGGKYGTLSEMAFALQKGLPVVSIQSWKVDDNVIQAESAEEAVDTLYKLIECPSK